MALHKLDQKFLRFLARQNAKLHRLLALKREAKQKLESTELIEMGFMLEKFLADHFDITLGQSLENWNKKQIVKREFVQRKIKAKYDNFEGEHPDFINEDKFTESFLQEGENEKLTNYARFALFTKEGQKLHQYGVLFNLPKPILPSFKIEESEIIYTKGDYFKKTREQNFLETKYCIYCHNQKKDYCRTKNPLNKQEGCPLDQPISEMNYAKAEGGVIAPLAILMVENPLCILTGDRICNDCKKACIFTKQTPVDVPSIESQILKDVLELPCGFEIYHLLTKWNPLDTVDFLPRLKNKHKVLVAGAGPAGIAACYYMLKAGFNVTLIDGQKLKRASASTSKREPSGFGGVMEYGITERWNKSLLPLAQSLLEREGGFAMAGGKKFGQDITVKSAKEMGFSHIMLCMGAGAPEMALSDFSLARGIFTASNFLMSAHLEKNWLERNLAFPVVVVGSGLTAIDAACLAKKYEGEVSIFMRGKLISSRSYNTNDLEVDEALYKKVHIFENKALVRLTYKNDSAGGAIVSGAIFQNKITGAEEFAEAKTIIFAVGTGQKNFPKDGFCSAYGDLNPSFQGSVVKAIASVKYGKDAAIKKILRKHPSLKKIDLKDRIYDIKQEGNLLCIKIKRGIKTPALPFSIFKLQTFQPLNHAIPLTLFENKNGILTFYIKNCGESFSTLAHLKKGEEVMLMQSSLNKHKFERVVCEDEDFARITKGVRMQDFVESKRKTLFYMQGKIEVKPKNNYYMFLFNEMGCMLSGVCSRCLTQKKDGSLFYSCKQNIVKLGSVKN